MAGDENLSRRYTRAELEALPILSVGQADDLHIEKDDMRVWLGRSDPFMIEIERRTPRGWRVVDRYPVR